MSDDRYGYFQLGRRDPFFLRISYEGRYFVMGTVVDDHAQEVRVQWKGKNMGKKAIFQKVFLRQRKAMVLDSDGRLTTI